MRRAEQASGRLVKRCPRCQRLRPHHTRGYCKSCYQVVRKHELRGTTPPPFRGKRRWTAEDVRYLETLLGDAGYTLQEAAEWLGKGVYAVRRKAQLLGLPCRGDHLLRPENRRRVAECRQCGRLHTRAAHGLCYACYMRERRRRGGGRVVECRRCGRERLHRAHGFCSSCYERRRYATGGRVVECRRCGRQRTHRARGLCVSCYQVEWARQKRERQRQEVPA